MRWLMIVLLASVGAMLFAAAGVARHIWLQRTKLHSNPDAGAAPHRVPRASHEPVEKADQEVEF
jgi:hypothetical protein